MEFLITILFGALVGWIASLIMNTDESQGAIMNIIVGIIGAMIGGLISRGLGGNGVTGFNVSSFLWSLFGAVLLIAFFKMVSRRSVTK